MDKLRNIEIVEGGKTLSDDLFVSIPGAPIGTYLDYDIYIKSKNLFDNRPIPPNRIPQGSKLIYTGRVYAGSKRLYINDIIVNFCYDYDYMKNPNYINKENPEHVELETIENEIFDIFVRFNKQNTTEIIENVYNYYSDIKAKEFKAIEDDSFSGKINNILNLRTDILPTIPLLPTTLKRNSMFYLGALLVFNSKYKEDSSSSITITTKGAGHPSSTARPSGIVCTFTDSQNQLTIGSNIISLIEGLDPQIYDSSNPTIGITSPVRDQMSKYYTPIAKIDFCPAEYYLIWTDRTGAYQSQRFNKRNIRTEQIKTSYSSDFLGYNNPIQKQVKTDFELNSDWITEEEMLAYESILTAPIVQLYDTKLERIYHVNVNTSKWEEKTKLNNHKLFNLKINLTLAKEENMIY